MRNLSSTEKDVILTDLIGLAKSDGAVNFSEMTYLVWVAQKLGVDQKELEKLLNRQRSDFDMISPDQRVQQFHHLLSMMFVDTRVEKEELEKCKDLGYKMGLDRNKVDQLIEDISENPDLQISLGELQTKFER